MQTTTPAELSDQDRADIVRFLKDHPIAVLATAGADGTPDASTIYFSVSDDLTLSFTTKRETLKHQNIQANDRVMLVTYDAASQSSVEAGGTAHEVTDPEEAQRIYQGTLNAAHRTGPDNVPPIAKIAAGPYVAYTITLENIKMNVYGWGDSFRHAMDHATDEPGSADPA